MAGEGQESEGVPGAGDHEHGHQGSFATGQEETEHHPERAAEEGDFATGEEHAKPAHEGSFAEGQEDVEHHPELPENKGDFAEGQEEEHSHPG
ncbi:MAG TPA: hypothetical protein VND54_01815 [Candidatus Saccharimonadales bacterium]|nr:hypothetical protein [Candidatus Saccharimonadales bacterium]